jgi:hypothetical protein
MKHAIDLRLERHDAAGRAEDHDENSCNEGDVPMQREEKLARYRLK